MTEEHDEQLSRLFRDTFEELDEEEFKSRVMDQVKRYERRADLSSYAVCFVVLVIVWFFAPEIQSAAIQIAVSPLGITPTVAREQVNLSLSPFLTIFGVVCAGYFLISIVSNGSKYFR
jgi:hypothetical protein